MTETTHRTQAQRREQTRTALLDATIDCLVEVGYARTSVQEICARAGVSKGAVQHHFTAKAELMAAAVEHLTTKLRRRLAESLDELPGGGSGVAAAIDLLWAGYSGTLSTAVTELWVAARTDPELRAAIRPVDRALGRATLEHVTQVAGELPPERAEMLFWLTVNLTRGLALDAELGGAPHRRRQLLEEWKRIAVLLYEDATAAPS
ncbi:TetR family transcriptional regulator [Amycolatopsis mediterranei S699]|uniref:TetR family transcriptional regulator n=2 Tax=Amycolatopsis mediterranei TaxID=33910 RepID=A0A0H3D438_AMYMU|nr:TetR/AcrR family transcriptional regulator [Amycolatopsis mediterranei]ADJ44273.1 TetR family transcriptional regulator [Amycolatopsis mediterranei U32]AEK41009.1 TetR family transcriptional regulator [Amycolatopsis mediterranei S699]AFO75986.1 TetR family transcriptional regulator [Amycolatopsis mediterranei S699]AGT83115.1 TetR family transcriptional regulator [Amycolatopsis mediterranei RB]KDO06810.1 TetR family transcriptional regulator [Amycolatopsis mediterranei]